MNWENGAFCPVTRSDKWVVQRIIANRAIAGRNPSEDRVRIGVALMTLTMQGPSGVRETTGARAATGARAMTAVQKAVT